MKLILFILVLMVVLTAIAEHKKPGTLDELQKASNGLMAGGCLLTLIGLALLLLVALL